MDTLRRDTRIAFRALLRGPGFTAVAVLTLALGIAANTTIFSVVYATFMAPLPYREADRLVMVWSHFRGKRGLTDLVDFLEWKRQAGTVFDELNACSWRSVNLATRDRPEHLQAGPVTPGYLPMLGYGHPLALGRDFLDGEATPGRDQVVILTHRLWRERFGADPDIVGRAVRIDGKPHIVVGVLGKGRADLNENQLWVPLAFTPGQLYDPKGIVYLNVMGRLKRGVTLEQANSVMAAINGRAAESYPRGTYLSERTVSVEPFRNTFLSEGTKRGLWLLLAAVAFVLLMACANVANLLLARGTAQARDLAVRAALGASGAQIARQLVTESLVLALVGGTLGMVLAAGLLRVVVALMPPFLVPTEADVRLNLPVLLFCLLASLFSGVLSGCAPAWHATRTNLTDALKQTGWSVKGGGHRVRQTLVPLEFALALTLLTGGGLALQSLLTLTRVDLGLHADHLLTFSLPISDDPPMLPDNTRAFYGGLIERIQALPGVASAAVATSMPLHRGFVHMPFTIPGKTPPDIQSLPFVHQFNIISPRYFGTLGIRVVRGRAFSEHDAPGAMRVAMVSQAFVRRYLPDVEPLSQRLVLPALGSECQIVGVFADVHHGGPVDEPLDDIAIPFAQTPWQSASIAVRTTGDPGHVRRSIESIVQSLKPDLPMADVKTMEQRVSESLANDRFNCLLFGSFAVVAVLLAAFGIYGVMSFAVAQRTREIGLRMALGAERGRVLLEVLRQATMTALAGCVLGSAGAWIAARALRGIVYGVGELDAGLFLVVVSVLLCTALLASLVPALRAASVQPMVALRQE